jgi:LIVCS family branched chain amino acid:cation symporter
MQKYAVFFAFFSFAVSNVGLSHIIAYALPVLYFLYPAAIVLIILCLLEGVLGYHRPLFVGTMIGTCTAAAFDFIKALSPPVQSALPGIHLLRTIGEALPLSVIGMGWVVPSITGLLLGSIVLVLQKRWAY